MTAPVGPAFWSTVQHLSPTAGRRQPACVSTAMSAEARAEAGASFRDFVVED